MGNITMSKKEINQISIFEKLVQKEMHQEAAAKILGMTSRQVRNKLRKYRWHGAKSLVHGNRGRPSKVKWAEKEKVIAFDLLQGEWKGFGPTFASEQLRERFGIKISKETLRKEMNKQGLWKAKKRKSKHRCQRDRKPYEGQMVQLDGSPHVWLELAGIKKHTLLVFIDDATSKILWLEFAKNESLESLMRSSKNYFWAHGRPNSFYVDHGSVFSVNLNNQEKTKFTQFERAMKELNIEIIHANSPQAKGRVERVNRTLQDRLVKELKMAGIKTIEEANEFAQNSYIPRHNAKFAVKPQKKDNIHRPINEYNLDEILCLKNERILQNNFVISYNKRLLQLEKEQMTLLFPKNQITVTEKLDGEIVLSIRKTKLSFHEIFERPKIKTQKPKHTTFPLWRPGPNHPWRKFQIVKSQLNV